MGGPGASWIPLPVIQAGATPVPVGLELVDPPASEPQLALAYTWGRVPAGAAPGSVVRYDLADGSRRDSTPFPPDAGVPVAADGDALPWMAVGTDRGHLVVTDGSGPTLRHAQVSEDRTRFLFPIAVGEDAFYGTYVFDAEIGWSPDALDARQSAHLVSRFSVLPELGVGRGGFVYDTELSVGDPAEG